MLSYIFLALVVISLSYTNGAKNCYDAQKDCRQDMTCTFIEFTYFQSCKRILKPSWRDGIYNFSTYSCPTKCVVAINKLRDNALGKEMENCDCQMDATCLTLKARTRRCIAASKQELQNKTGCTAARTKCIEDPICLQAEKNFLLKCSQMISGVECSKECLNSQEKLFSLDSAKSLKTCECDGLTEPYCHGIRAHAEYLCNKRIKIEISTQKGELVLAEAHLAEAEYSSSRTCQFSPFLLAVLVFMAGDLVG